MYQITSNWIVKC